MKKWALPAIFATIMVFASAYFYLVVRMAVADVASPLVASRTQAVAASAASVERLFAEVGGQTAVAAAALEPWNGSVRQALDARPVLDRLLAAAPVLDGGAFVVDRRGGVAAYSSSVAALNGQIRKAGYIDEAFAGKVTWSPVVRDPLLREPFLETAAPVKDPSGSPAAVLVGLSKASSMASRATSLARAAGGTGSALVDSSGQAVDDKGGVGTPSADVAPAITAAQSRAKGFLEYRGEGGVQKAGAYARTAQGWTVVVFQNSGDFYASTARIQRFSELGAAALLVLAIAFILIMQLRWAATTRRTEEATRSFLAIAGHELRTPLTVIRGFTQTLLGRWGKVPDARRKEIVGQIARQSRNLEHLIERLLLAAQLDSGVGQVVIPRHQEIGPQIAQIVDYHRSLSPIHELVVDAESPLPAEVDSKAFEQVMSHLIENAIKYSPSGGKVWVSARKRASSIVITVEDEGVGLPADASRIFDRFGQGEHMDRRTHDEGGVGLGLFIVKTHLARMGGSVKAERRKEGGARFVVSLPS
jgi:signal transduction histidine kinase